MKGEGVCWGVGEGGVTTICHKLTLPPEKKTTFKKPSLIRVKKDTSAQVISCHDFTHIQI